MKKIIATFLLTSIFWLVLFLLLGTPAQEECATAPLPNTPLTENPPAAEPAAAADATPRKREATAADRPAATPRPQQKTQQKKRQKQQPDRTPGPEPVVKAPESIAKALDAPQRPDPASELIGRWEPVEGAKNPLEFTRYGTVIQWIYKTIDQRHEYSASDSRITFGREGAATFAVTHDGPAVYLEISGHKEYSGKYRLAKRPRPLRGSPLAPDDLAEAIIGKWKPENGAKCPLEFTRYGTFIQWIYNTIDQRHEYAVAGSSMKIGRRGNARIVITPTASGTYLEIYDNTEFSGRYLKTD